MSEYPFGREGKMCRCSGTEHQWLPVSVARLVTFLNPAVPQWEQSGYIINRNTAYALQFCQQLRIWIEAQEHTNALRSQHIRAYTHNTFAVVEAILEYQLKYRKGLSQKVIPVGQIHKLCDSHGLVLDDAFWTAFDELVTPRNRSHLTKHEDVPEALERDTGYNYFLNLGHRPAANMLHQFLAGPLFAASSHRIGILEAFPAAEADSSNCVEGTKIRLRRSA